MRVVELLPQVTVLGAAADDLEQRLKLGELMRTRSTTDTSERCGLGVGNDRGHVGEDQEPHDLILAERVVLGRPCIADHDEERVAAGHVLRKSYLVLVSPPGVAGVSFLSSRSATD